MFAFISYTSMVTGVLTGFAAVVRSTSPPILLSAFGPDGTGDTADVFGAEQLDDM